LVTVRVGIFSATYMVALPDEPPEPLLRASGGG
jgi:hypothetical protein